LLSPLPFCGIISSNKNGENIMGGALDHLLVLDLTSHLSGPYCAMLLADHGAEVIKIEPPKGDSARGMPPFINGESAPFMTWNRNKRSVVLDLKQADDKAALLQLIDKADILVENYRPGVRQSPGSAKPARIARAVGST
jgi:crotonobetainyl-CoA:carnitine CoA-transferase CaiB-like acyl-CoA transferase